MAEAARSASCKIHFPFKEESEMGRACQYGGVHVAAGGKRVGRALHFIGLHEGGGGMRGGEKVGVWGQDGEGIK